MLYVGPVIPENNVMTCNQLNILHVTETSYILMFRKSKGKTLKQRRKLQICMSARPNVLCKYEIT